MRDKHEFKPIAVEVEESPVSPLGRFTFWVVLAIVAFAITWLSLAEVDIVITTRGKVVPEGQVKVIQPLDAGVIKAIHVETGSKVKKGDLLVEIEPEPTEAAIASSDQSLLLLELESLRINAMLSNRPFSPDRNKYPLELISLQQTLYQTGLQSHQQLVSAKQQEIEQLLSQLRSNEADKQKAVQLLALNKNKTKAAEHVKDLLSRRELEQLAEDHIIYQAQETNALAQEQKIHQQLLQLQNELSHLDINYRNQLLEELAQKEQQVIELSAKSKEWHYRNTRQRLISPVSGTINQRMINTIGGVVRPADPILTIVPRNMPLVVEALVENKDIGYLQEGMQAEIKVDTYDFQKYGTLEGVVQKISSDAIQNEKLGEVFQIVIKPKTKYLMTNNQKKALNSGMETTSEIKIGKRRMIEFFLYPAIKAVDETFSLK